MAHSLRNLAALPLLLLAGCDYLFGSGSLPWPEPGFLPVEAGAVETTHFGNPTRLHLCVDANGEIRKWGEVVARENLPELFLRYAERWRDTDAPDEPSLVHLKVSPDRRAPWAAIRDLLWRAYAEDVRMYLIEFRVLQETSRRGGTLYAELPRRNVHLDPYRLPPEFEHSEIQIRGPGPVDRELLYAAILAAPDGPVVIRAEGDMATGEVLRAYDVVLRAGRKTVLLAPNDPAGPGREPLLVNGRAPVNRSALPPRVRDDICLRPDDALPPVTEEKR